MPKIYTQSTQYFLAGDTLVEDMTYWGLGGCEGLTGKINHAWLFGFAEDDSFFGQKAFALFRTIFDNFNGRWWIVGRVRFLRINISCLTSSLWRSAQKEALKALEDSWKVLDGPMYAVEGLGRSLETKIPHHISIAFSHLSLNPHLHYVWFHKKTKSDKWWGVSWYPQKWWRNFLTATKRMNPYSAEWIKIYVVFCVSKALISMIYYMHSHPPRQGVQYKLITSAWLLGCY